MPDDETNLERRSLGEGGCPACPPGHTTVIPAVPNDAAPGTIPDEHLAVLRANASRPEVKARFIESMMADSGIPISDFSAAEAVTLETPAKPQNVRIHPPRDVSFGREEQAPFGAAARLRQPPLHPPEPRHMRSDVPTRREGGASYIRLHAYTDLPDVGPPQYIRHMTQPAAGISDPITKAALFGLPLSPVTTGALYTTLEGCKGWTDFYWKDGDPAPGDDELAAVMKFVEDNWDSLEPGDWFEVTLEPSKVVVYWQWVGGFANPPVCQSIERFRREGERPSTQIILDMKRQAGRVHKVTARSDTESAKDAPEPAPPPAQGSGQPQPPQYTCPLKPPQNVGLDELSRRIDLSVPPAPGGAPTWLETWAAFVARRVQRRVEQAKTRCERANGYFYFAELDRDGLALAGRDPEVWGAKVVFDCFTCQGTCPPGQTCTVVDSYDAAGNLLLTCQCT